MNRPSRSNFELSSKWIFRKLEMQYARLTKYPPAYYQYVFNYLKSRNSIKRFSRGRHNKGFFENFRGAQLSPEILPGKTGKYVVTSFRMPDPWIKLHKIWRKMPEKCYKSLKRGITLGKGLELKNLP